MEFLKVTGALVLLFVVVPLIFVAMELYFDFCVKLYRRAYDRWIR